MFSRAVIHYPTDDKALKQVYKEIASFRLDATVKYISSLGLNDRQLDTLFDEVEREVAIRRKSA